MSIPTDHPYISDELMAHRKRQRRWLAALEAHFARDQDAWEVRAPELDPLTASLAESELRSSISAAVLDCHLTEDIDRLVNAFEGQVLHDLVYSSSMRRQLDESHLDVNLEGEIQRNRAEHSRVQPLPDVTTQSLRLLCHCLGLADRLADLSTT